MIQTEKGRVFINGKESVDPTLIGYAILDIVESGNDISISNKASFDEIFKERDFVYLVHDEDQIKRMITGFEISNDNILYLVSSGESVSKHYSYELSKKKIIV